MHKSFKLAAALALTLAAGSTAAFAEGRESVHSIRASQVQVAEACAEYEGIALITAGRSGQYGCYTRTGWIQCELDGNCTGARYTGARLNDDAHAKLGGTVEGVLAGFRTRLTPRYQR